MLRFALGRLLTAIPTLFVIVTASFFMMRFAPGGPFDVEKAIDPQVLANLKRIYKLDQPLWAQYLDFLANLARGDLGPSYFWRDFTTMELFAKALPISVTLGLSALALALLIGGSLGIIAALRQNQPADYAVSSFATAGITVPNFVVAPLLQLGLGLSLKWLPIGGLDMGWKSYVMPVITLALPQIAVVARLMRASMIETMRSHHIRTARALGLPAHVVVLKHALRGAVLPIISYSGPAAAALLTGSVVVETIFAVPGIGRYFVESALNRDYTMVMGAVIVVAVFTIVFNLLVDMLYAILDPRVRLE
jgi:oligopeptide transport system permease protein